MPALTCRFYEHRYPEIEDVVKVTVLSIAEMGAYVHLLEYNKIEGMILLSELSRRRIRSINKLIRIGREECVVVIRVDKEKGYIDLSKRRVSAEEVAKCEDKFAKAKCVNSILTHVAQLRGFETDAQLEDLYQKTAWHFDRKFGKPGAAYEAFKNAVVNPDVLNECDIDEETKKILLTDIKRKLTPQAAKIRAEIEVSCYGYRGIFAIKDALRAGKELSTEELPIKINLLASPVYLVTTQTLDKTSGIDKLNEALVLIKNMITKEDGGIFSIKMAPKVVSDIDEQELAEKMERLRKENEEVSGDDDDDDDDDTSDDGEEKGDGKKKKKEVDEDDDEEEGEDDVEEDDD